MSSVNVATSSECCKRHFFPKHLIWFFSFFFFLSSISSLVTNYPYSSIQSIKSNVVKRIYAFRQSIKSVGKTKSNAGKVKRKTCNKKKKPTNPPSVEYVFCHCVQHDRLINILCALAICYFNSMAFR